MCPVHRVLGSTWKQNEGVFMIWTYPFYYPVCIRRLEDNLWKSGFFTKWVPDLVISLYLFFWNLLCRPVWLWTHGDLPVCPSMLGLKAFASTTRLSLHFLRLYRLLQAIWSTSFQVDLLALPLVLGVLGLQVHTTASGVLWIMGIEFVVRLGRLVILPSELSPGSRVQG